MVTSEFEEKLESVSDAELLRQAIKYLRMVYLQLDDHGSKEDIQEILDYLYMECSKRGKEWIFDKAQDACVRQSGSVCAVPVAEHDSM